METKRILVTGANGYVGKYVIDELKNRNFEIVCLIHRGTSFESLKGKVNRVVIGDLLDKESLEDAVKSVDAVIHLAAAVRITSPKINYEVNSTGTKNLIDVCTAHGVKRVVFTSSVSILKKKRGPYGESKLMAEKHFEKSSLDYTIFRPTMIYGIEGKGINNVINYTLKFPFFIPLIGHGKWTRQPVSVYDVAKVLVDSIDNKRTYRKTYPLAGKNAVQFRELVDIVAKAAGVKKIKIPIPVFLCYFAAVILEKVLPKPPFTSENVRSLSQNTEVDISEMLRDTNFHFIDLEKGISELIREMKEEKLIKV